MKSSNPMSDFIQFIIGVCFFAAGVFLLSNQEMVRAPIAIGGSSGFGYSGIWGAEFAFSWGSPGMGLLLLPLRIGLCMAFADVYARWSKLLIWGSLAALFMGVLTIIRMSFVSTTLWQLGVYVAITGIGGELMFKGFTGSGGDPPSPKALQLPTQASIDGPMSSLRVRRITSRPSVVLTFWQPATR